MPRALVRQHGGVAHRPCSGRTRSGPRPRTGRRWCRVRRSRAAAGTAVVPAVDERVPVDVADVARAAGPHEAHRHDRSRFLRSSSMNLPLVSALRWTSSRERTDAPRSPSSTSCVMNHSGNCQAVMPVGGAVGSSLSGGGAKSLQASAASSRRLQLLDQPRLVDLLAAAGPVVQAADEDRVVRQVEHRARAERRDDLALADLAVRAASWSRRSFVVLLDLDVVERLAATGSRSAPRRASSGWRGTSGAAAAASSAPGSRKSYSSRLAAPASRAGTASRRPASGSPWAILLHSSSRSMARVAHALPQAPRPRPASSSACAAARSASVSTTKSSFAPLVAGSPSRPVGGVIGAWPCRASATSVAGQAAVERPRRERRHAGRLDAAVERLVVGREPLVVRAVARPVDVEQRDDQARPVVRRGRRGWWPGCTRRWSSAGRARPSGRAG